MEPSEGYSGEQLYTKGEIFEILRGLLYVYYAQPWYSKWMWKPWFNAIGAAMMIFNGESILSKHIEKEAVKDFEDLVK